ncbi:hypothetical protein JNUCC76_04985 [Leuconostoc sp. JNUCC 76]
MLVRVGLVPLQNLVDNNYYGHYFANGLENRLKIAVSQQANRHQSR